MGAVMGTGLYGRAAFRSWCQHSQGREYSIVLLWGTAHSPLHPTHPDWGASPAGASAADSCKKYAKIAEPESTCTRSIKLAKVGFWEGSDLFVSVLVDCLFYGECLLSLKSHFRCFLSKKTNKSHPHCHILNLPCSNAKWSALTRGLFYTPSAGEALWFVFCGVF